MCLSSFNVLKAFCVCSHFDSSYGFCFPLLKLVKGLDLVLKGFPPPVFPLSTLIKKLTEESRLLPYASAGRQLSTLQIISLMCACLPLHSSHQPAEVPVVK